MTTSFPPVTSARLKLGVCDTCHRIQLDAKGKIANPQLAAILGIDFTIGLFRWERRIRLKKSFRKEEFPGNPSITIDLLKICLIREYEEGSLVCGSECCDSSIPKCAVKPSTSEKTCSTPSPTPTSTPTEDPRPPSIAGIYTDPHIVTLDGLHFDCQATGEFVLSQSKRSKFEVQARFQGESSRGTVTTGIAVKVSSENVVQVSIAGSNSSNFEQFGACRLAMAVDGKMRKLSSGSGIDKFVSVTALDDLGFVEIELDNGVSVNFRLSQSTTFGCYLEHFKMTIPRRISDLGDVRGLLGSPNFKASDEWQKRNGEVIPIPMDTLFEAAYNYCTKNWCTRTKEESLFTYENGESFSGLNGCNEPYKGALDFSGASEELKVLCGSDSACLVDGLVGGLEAGRNALTVQAEIESAISASSRFRFQPSNVAVDSKVDVVVTMNISSEIGALGSDIESFALYRVNSNTGKMTGARLLKLVDDGRGSSFDQKANDFVFTNVLSLRIKDTGGRQSFRAVPIINGAEVRSSDLGVTALDAVRSYSAASGVVNSDTDLPRYQKVSANVDFVDGLELYVKVSARSDQTALDISGLGLGVVTQFFANEVPGPLQRLGNSCVNGFVEESREYMSEDQNQAAATVQLDKAKKDGSWDDYVSLFFSPTLEGPTTLEGPKTEVPVTLTTVLRDSVSKKEISQSRLSLSTTVVRNAECFSLNRYIYLSILQFRESLHFYLSESMFA